MKVPFDLAEASFLSPVILLGAGGALGFDSQGGGRLRGSLGAALRCPSGYV